MKDIIFKKGKQDDIKKFLSFFRKSIKTLFPQYSENSYLYTVDVDYGPEWLTKKISKNKKHIYLAEHKGILIGYLLVSKAVAGVAYADWLGVDKEYQKNGIATEFMSMWEKDAIKEGAHALYLWTTNNKNINFYKKREFSLSGKFPKAWHGHDTYLMYKVLREPKEENYLKNYLKTKNKNL